MKTFFCLLLLILLFMSSQVVVVRAGSKTEAEKLLKTVVNDVFEILSNKELPIDQRKNKVVKITNEIFNLDLIAKLALGKGHWAQFNLEQRTEFTNLFIEMAQNMYTSMLDLFSDEKVLFKTTEVSSEKKVRISTILISRGKEFSVLYKMGQFKDVWKVYDVEIEGVSLIHTYRSQFNHTLSNNTPKDLLKIMKERNTENK